MHWHCDMQSAEAVQPSWPLLPETAMVLQPKDSAKGQLLQEEIAVCETMGAKRQLDFTSGRCCAHIAQALLGLSQTQFCARTEHPFGQQDSAVASATANTGRWRWYPRICAALA